ncbi:MAG: T9SS type A sorting domain-containing protein [Ignavibacteria bacterium]|nr:T9SS type A sorting domain-containing protein [Ignavibacteria bacterium]
MSFGSKTIATRLLILLTFLAFATVINAQGSIPAPVLNLPVNGASIDPTNINLSWSDSGPGASYLGQYSKDISFASGVDSFLVGSTGTTVASVDAGSKYYWRVKVTTATDTSDWSSVFSFTTQLPQPVLTTPANNSFMASTTTLLKWNAVPGAVKYTLAISTDPGLLGSTNTYDIAGTNHSVSGLLFNTTYYWSVKAVNAADSSAFAGIYHFTTELGASTLTGPTNYSVGNVTNPVLSWAAVNGATGYRVQLASDSLFSALISDDTVAANTKPLSSLPNDTKYYWRVQAVNAQNIGQFSGFYSFLTQLVVPTLASPADNSKNQVPAITLNWAAVAGANRYTLQISRTADFSSGVTTATNLAVTNYHPAGLEYYTTYYWKVKAYSTVTGNYGNYSSPWSFQTKLAPPVLTYPASGAVNMSIQPILRFRPVIGAASYHLQFALGSDFTHPIIDTVGLADTLLPILTELANSTTYSWRVAAVNPVSTSDYTTFSFTTVPLVLAFPSHPLGGQLVYTLTPRLYWYINVPAPGIQFDVLYSTDISFPAGQTTVGDAADSISYQITTNLIPGTKYYWKVRTKYPDNIIVKYSAIDSFTTYGAPLAPIAVYPTTGNTVYNLSPVLSWHMNLVVPFYTFEYRYKQSASLVWSAPVNTGSDLSDTLTGLVAGESYDWQVRSNNGNTVSPWSSTQTFSIAGSSSTSAPVPVISYPTANASIYTTTPTLYWYVIGSTNGLSYDIEVKKDTNFTGVATDTAISGWSLEKSGFLPGTTYFWRVRSNNGHAPSAWSARESFTIIAPAYATVPVLTYPVDSASVYTASPTLYFYSNSYYAGTKYDVQWKIDDTSFSTPTGSVSGLTEPSYKVLNLLAGKTYFWRARSTNGANFSAWSAPEAFSTCGTAGSLVPVPVWPVNNFVVSDSTLATISWYVNGYSVQPLHYDIALCTNDSFYSATYITGISESPYTFTGLTPGNRYYYKIRSFNGNAYSAWSGVQSFTTTSAVLALIPRTGSPVNLVLVPVNSPVLSWFTFGHAAGNVKYEVQYADNAQFSNAITVKDIAVKYLQIGNLIKGKTYYWRVRSVGAAGVLSQYSQTGQFIADGTSDVAKNTELPKQFYLAQNYPNPFNPTTVIKFGLPEQQIVTLRIYNILGQEVAAILQSASLKAGSYEYTFNASKLASGVYIYRLDAGKNTEIKKMMLMK